MKDAGCWMPHSALDPISSPFPQKILFGNGNSLIEVAEDPHSTLPKAPCFIFKGSSIKVNVVLPVPLCPLNYLVLKPLFCFVLFHFCLKGRGLEMTTSVTA